MTPQRIGDALDVIAGAREHFRNGATAESAMSLLQCHTLDGDVQCDKMATHLYGEHPYHFAPHCDEHGEAAA